jgi:tRNA dimethylallyltransferase
MAEGHRRLPNDIRFENRDCGLNKNMPTNLNPTSKPIFLVGATGTGKSDVAMELARQTGAAILAMDAMQVYRGTDIGTGKPTAADRAEIPHGGLDLADIGEPFDVARYLEHAAAFLQEQRHAGRQVIIAGGTGLYFRALTRGLCEAPQASDELRAELQALSTDELRERLLRVDPAMVPHLDASNPRRLARAIEVMESTGRSLRDWQSATPSPLIGDHLACWLQREKDELQQRIDRRIEAMFAAGWIDEVRRLVERHGLHTVRRFPGIGYREIAGARDGEELISARSDILVATRQYAKRQLTWFNREPNLKPVMLTGIPSISAALLSLP